MKVLMVHNHYQTRGGEDESFAAETALLRAHGHTVHTITEHNDRVHELGRARTAIRTVWSREANHAVRAAIQQHRPDVMHVQNTFPLLSPSIYSAAHAEHVPIVQSVRNYRLFCLNAYFHRDGHVCEDCLGHAIPWPGVKHRCYHDSAAGSVTVAAMLTTHRALRTWRRLPARFIAISEFTRNKCIEGGLDPALIDVKPNFVDPDPGPGRHAGGFALFVGRLSPEKGVDTLLHAWDGVDDLPELRIIGDGPLSDRVASAAAGNPRVSYLGRSSSADVLSHMKDAAFLVFPTEWYETFGRVAIESFAAGTPVIASGIGAVAEVVQDGVTGLHVPPGDPSALRKRARWLSSNPAARADMGAAARRTYLDRYTAERNYQQLIDIYQRARFKAQREVRPATSQSTGGST